MTWPRKENNDKDKYKDKDNDKDKYKGKDNDKDKKHLENTFREQP